MKRLLLASLLLLCTPALGQNWQRIPNLEVDNLKVTNLIAAGAPWYDVTDREYGADPTGVTDSVPAFAALETAICAAGGGVLYIPPGTFKMTNPVATAAYVTLNCDNIFVVGAGPGITIVEADAADAEAVNQTLFEFEDCDNCGIFNLSLHGNNVNQADTTGANNGYRGKGVTRFVAANIYAQEFQYHCGGVRPSATRGSTDFVLRDSWCDGGHETGWIVYSTNGEEIAKNTGGLLSNLWATGSDTYYGIEVRYSDNITITDCHVWDNDGGGINIEESADDITIKGCHIQSNGVGGAGNGINTQCIDNTNTPGSPSTTLCDSAAERIEGLKLIGNVVTGNTGSGIRLDQLDTVLIEGNTLSSNTEHGISISSSANVPTKLIVSNNYIESNGGHGVNDWRATDSAFVGRNVITGHPTSGDAGIEIVVSAAARTHIAQETYFNNNANNIFFSDNSDTCLTRTSATTVEDAEACRYLTFAGTATITTINHCAAGNNGALITVVCGATAPVLDDDAANIRLSGADTSFTCGADDTLTLMCEGSTGDWLEVARSVN